MIPLPNLLVYVYLFAEKIKTFLGEFYNDADDGGKDFKYGQQLVQN